MEETLLTARPDLTTQDAVRVLARVWGVRADDARDLGSERDRTFLLTVGGAPRAVLKVSNPAEDPDVLDMEAAAAWHAHRVDPGLGVALPWTVPGHEDVFRAAWQDGAGATCWVRAYDVLPGASRIDPTALSDRALHAWGRTTARLGRALRGFSRPGSVANSVLVI